VRNSSLVKCSCADNVTGLKPIPEAVGFVFGRSGRRAFCSQRSGDDESAVEAAEVRMLVLVTKEG
jgi:hypothetical protein